MPVITSTANSFIGGTEMPTLPLIFKQCKPRREILAGELPDAIFAADLWDVITGNAHKDYQDPSSFFAGTHPTENLKLLVRDVCERMAGMEGSNPVYRLETGFGGGKTHGLIAAVHVSQKGSQLANTLEGYGIKKYPNPGEVRVAAFVGEDSDPLSGNSHIVDGQQVRTFTPWGQIALLAGGLAGYEKIKENDEKGIAPGRGNFEEALGQNPVLIVIDELVLYMARIFALPDGHPRQKVNSQWATFLQTLFSIAARRPRTSVILTLPSEQDANRRLTKELKQYIPTLLETVDEVEQTTSRHAKNLTPTQSYERASVIARRLFETVDSSFAGDIARAYTLYYEKERNSGVAIDSRAFEADYAEQIRIGYPFHPELIRLFAERLADIPEFQATRGALRLIGRTIRSVWANKKLYKDAFLLQPHHVDLTHSDVKDEILARLNRGAFQRGLEADIVRAEGGTHANQVESGWPWKAATEASLVTFLHSLPSGSKGSTPSEVALAIGRPGCDLAYITRGLEETERHAWYMRREGDHYLFRTRASVNKRFQERLSQVQAPEIRETLDNWVQDVYTGFSAFQIIPFPKDHTVIPDTSERVRLIVVHYDKECGAVGGGDRLNFVKGLFTQTGVNNSPRRYKNNLIFLLAESTRITGLKDAVQALIAWERVRKDIETEQTNLAQSSGSDFKSLKEMARRGATGVPAEFMALESDLGEVLEKLGTQELNVRYKLLEAYRVLAFPKGQSSDQYDLFSAAETGSLLECYRVDLGEKPDDTGKAKRNVRRAIAEGPILQCLRENNKLVPEAKDGNPLVLAPSVVKSEPLWRKGEKKISTEDVWERLRSNPELPIVLRQTDLLPTFREGLVTEPDALWSYYDQADKKVYTRESANTLSSIIATSHFIYDVAAAINDKIVPVSSVTPKEIWEYLWPKTGTERAATIAPPRLLEQAKNSLHFPVMPGRDVLWQALSDGARENRWILYMRGPRLSIGAQEMNEWPGTPQFEENVELWTYQAALDQGIYPRDETGGGGLDDKPLTPQNVREYCWSKGADQVGSEDLERYARAVWPDLSRPRFETVLKNGLAHGQWAVWNQGQEESFHMVEDTPVPLIHVNSETILVDPTSDLALQLEELRPGKGPQPVTHAGTPREVLIKLWEDLSTFRNVHIREMLITATDRDSLDNTLVATWADRPVNTLTHVSLSADGQREVGGKKETVNLQFEGRFDELRTMLSPIWPFSRNGQLDVTVQVILSFEPTVPLDDLDLETYKNALMNANQGELEIRIKPVRNKAGRSN